MKQQIAIVDYGMGNLRSVAKAVEYVADSGAEVVVTADAGCIANADRVVFPGQGAAAACMDALHYASLGASVKKAFQEKPFLGICMGMQVLMTSSEENGGVSCLGLIPGQVKDFERAVDIDSAGLTIPQMGWNQVKQSKEHAIWQGIEDHARFYFAHSYFVEPENGAFVIGETQYGLNYACALASENVFAVQFHPEKSANDGLRLLKNFVYWNGVA